MHVWNNSNRQHSATFRGFLDFIRDKGVVGLAIGFIAASEEQRNTKFCVVRVTTQYSVNTPQLAAELGAGRRLGMTTVQTLRPGVEKWHGADHHITSFAELPGIIAACEGDG